MTVLIVTKSDDNPCIDTVAEHLKAAGRSAFRLDTDRFPTEVTVEERHGDGHSVAIVDVARGERVHSDEIEAVWYRRFSSASLPDDMEESLRAPSKLEAREVLLSMMAALPCFTMDPYDVVRRAAHKSLQLRVAREEGLAIPRTLTTNDPDAVRRFVASCPEGVIAKMLSSFAVYDDAGREQVVFTNRLRDGDLDDLSGLALCPMTFQEEIPKAVELRATVVGRRVFTAAVDSKALAGAEVDWRRRGRELLGAWEPYALPADVEAALLRLTSRLGLNYGAADLIVRPDGTHVFLEINPGGEFFWLDGPLPITKTMADVLRGEGRAALL